MAYEKYQRFIEENLEVVDKETRSVIPFQLNQIQQSFLKDATGNDIILKARQQGFSTLIGAIFVGDFILVTNSVSVIVADISDNAIDLLARVKAFIASYERINNLKVPLKYNSKYELENAVTGARYIIGTAENVNFGRSKTITNLHLSEAAFYPKLNEILTSAGTALVPNGKFIIETTANGYNEFKNYWDEAVAGLNGFSAHFYKASAFYSKEFLEREQKRLGRSFPQEYPETPEEAFLNSGDMFFDRERLAVHQKFIQSHTLKFSAGTNFTQYRELEPNELIVAGVDTAAGGLDYCAAQFISTTKKDVPIVYHAKELASDMTPRLHSKLIEIYSATSVKPVIAYERNNGGVFELERLARLNKQGQYKIYQTKKDMGTIMGTQVSPKLGWSTDTSSRPVMLADLKDAIDNFYLTIYDTSTLSELFSFVIVQTTSSWKAQAENGMHDDLLMALAIAWQLYQTESVSRSKSEPGVIISGPKKSNLPDTFLVNPDGKTGDIQLGDFIAEAMKEHKFEQKRKGILNE